MAPGVFLPGAACSPSQTGAPHGEEWGVSPSAPSGSREEEGGEERRDEVPRDALLLLHT